MTPEELDRWSAIEVMGWESDGVDYHEKNSLIWRMHHEDWHPSKDLNQAFMVVERMKELGWLLRFSVWSDEYQAWFTTKSKAYPDTYDPSPCVAILKAAKAAREEKT